MPSPSVSIKSPRITFKFPKARSTPHFTASKSANWLDAEWKDTSTGREAKFYTLTNKGKKQLEAEVLGWERLSDAVSLILRTAD